MVSSLVHLHGCTALKHWLDLAVDSLIRSKAWPLWYNQLWPWPISATHIEDLAVPLRFDQHQLPALNVQLHLYDSIRISYQHRTSSCTSMTRPTSATHIEHLVAPIYDFDHTSYRHQPSSQRRNTTIMNFTQAFVNMTNKLPSLLYCYLTFVSFIVFWLSLLARLTL